MGPFSRGLTQYKVCTRPIQLRSTKLSTLTSSIYCHGRRFSIGASLLTKSTSKLVSTRSPSRGPGKNIAAKPTTKPGIQSHMIRHEYKTFGESLASKSESTLLYKAPPHGSIRFISYSTGIFLLGVAGFSFIAHYVNPPKGLPVWVSGAWAGICFALSGMAGWFFLGSIRLISSITAIPIKVKGSPPGLQLRIEVRRAVPFPFLKPRILSVDPKSISLSARLHDPLMVEYRREKEWEEERIRELDRRSRLTAPFRNFSYGSWKVMGAFKRVWFRHNFISLSIEDRTGVWKIDQEGGWMLDDGRAMDRLVKLRPDAQLKAR